MLVIGSCVSCRGGGGQHTGGSCVGSFPTGDFVTLPVIVTSANRQLGGVRQQVALPPPPPSARADKTAIFQCYPLPTGRQHVWFISTWSVIVVWTFKSTAALLFANSTSNLLLRASIISTRAHDFNTNKAFRSATAWRQEPSEHIGKWSQVTLAK